MAKVTGKLQVTVRKAPTAQLGVRPGDDVDGAISGGSLHAAPAKQRRQALDLDTRLRLFHEATDRQRRRQRDAPVTPADGGRGWSREDLYERNGVPVFPVSAAAENEGRPAALELVNRLRDQDP